MVSVVDRIIEIENKSHLYEYVDDKGIPVWDVLRYDVIKAIEYKYNPNKSMLPKSSLAQRIIILLESAIAFLRLFFLGEKRVLFFASLRYKDKDGQCYDRVANDLILRVDKGERVVLDTTPRNDTRYKTLTTPVGLFYALCKKYELNQDFSDYVVEELNKGFQDNVITSERLQYIYSQFVSQTIMFNWILKRTKPEKIFISYGRFKPLCWTAKRLGIPTWLMQHSLIERDDATLSGTCPDKRFAINADVLLTFGTYWGDYLKHLMSVQVIGNRILSKSDVNVAYNGPIVFASSLYQGPYISDFLVGFASKHPDLSFVYKLHPGEKQYMQRYRDLFINCHNVRVVLDEMTMDELLVTCSLVVLVSSTTFYEALNLKKCVAIYNIKEFESITRFLLKVPNSYPFTEEEELENIIKDATFYEDQSISFFEPFNEELAEQLINQ